MLIANTGQSLVVMNLRTGEQVQLPPGQLTPVADSKIRFIDDSAVLIALFNSGLLVAYTDAGASYPGFPTIAYPGDSKVIPPVDADYAAAVVSAAGSAIPDIRSPYRIATFGDSRANVGGTSLAANATGTTFNADRVATAVANQRPDIAIVFNGGLSGGFAANWANNSDGPTGRVTAVKTVADLLASAPDACLFQFGINDIMNWDGASPSPASFTVTLVANLQAAVAAIMNGGVFVVFESINPAAPASITFVNGYSAAGGFGTNAAAKLQAMTDVNNAMRAWLSAYPTRGMYVDTSGATAGSDGYAKTNKTYVDGVHLSAMGARGCAALILDAIKSFFPVRPVVALAPKSRSGVNGMLINATAGKAEGWDVLAETGTWAAEQWSIEGDSQVVTLQCNGLVSGYCRRIITVLPSFIGASTLPVLAAGDILSARVEYEIDDGAGGPPPLYGISIRPRLYYNDASNEFTAGNQAGSQTSTDYPPMPAHRGYLHSPGQAVKAAMSNSTIIAPTALQFQVVGNQTGRTRIKFRGAEWRKIS